MRVGGKSSGVGSTQGVGAAKGPMVGATSSVQANAAPLGADALSVSGTAHFIAVARAHLARIPDIRMAKVAALKSKLDNDEYHPDGEAVADGLVKEHTPPRSGA